MSAHNVGYDDIEIVDVDAASDSDELGLSKEAADEVDLKVSPMRLAVAKQRHATLNAVQNILASTPGINRFISPVVSPAVEPVLRSDAPVNPVNIEAPAAAPTDSDAPSNVASGSKEEEKDSGKDTKQPSETRQSSTLSDTVIPKDLPDPTVQPDGAPSLEVDPSCLAAWGGSRGVNVVDPRGESAKVSSVDVNSKGEGDGSIDPKVHRLPEESARPVVTPGGVDGPNVEPKPDPRDGTKVGEVPPPPPQPSDLSLQQQLKALQESHDSNNAREKKIREREASLFKLTQSITEKYERVKQRERKNSELAES